MTIIPLRSNRVLQGMLLWLVLGWIVTAINPLFPRDRLLENLLVFIYCALLAFTYRRFQFSNLSYGLFVLFLSLHLVGAKELLDVDPTSSLMYSSVATEVVLKSVLLKPVIFGLVHTESLAELVANMLVKQTGVDRFKKQVFEILENHIEFDDGFAKYSREGSNLNLWEERQKIHGIRNKIMHQAVFCDKEDAELSYSVALTFFCLTKLLIENVGFSIKENLLVSS